MITDYVFSIQYGVVRLYRSAPSYLRGEVSCKNALYRQSKNELVHRHAKTTFVTFGPNGCRHKDYAWCATESLGRERQLIGLINKQDLKSGRLQYASKCSGVQIPLEHEILVGSNMCFVKIINSTSCKPSLFGKKRAR